MVQPAVLGKLRVGAEGQATRVAKHAVDVLLGVFGELAGGGKAPLASQDVASKPGSTKVKPSSSQSQLVNVCHN